MGYLFLINTIISTIIFIIITISLFKHYNNLKLRKIVNALAILGFFYLAIATLSLLWNSKIINYEIIDYVLIYSILIVFQTIILFYVVYSITSTKKLFYFLIFYIFSLFSISISIRTFPHLLLISSFLLTAIMFTHLYFKTKEYKTLSYFGVLYSTISLIIHIIIFNKIGYTLPLTIIINVLFLIFITYFLIELKRNPPKIINKKRKKESHMVTSIKLFIFIITLTNFIFIGTIGLHEFGHVTSSKFYDCEYRNVIYQDGSQGEGVRTELLCLESPNSLFVILAGIMFPLIIAAAVFFVGGKLMKEMSLLLAGFNLLISYRDLNDLVVSQNLIISIIALGIILIILGIATLAKTRVEEHDFSYFG